MITKVPTIKKKIIFAVQAVQHYIARTALSFPSLLPWEIQKQCDKNMKNDKGTTSPLSKQEISACKKNLSPRHQKSR